MNPEKSAIPPADQALLATPWVDDGPPAGESGRLVSLSVAAPATGINDFLRQGAGQTRVLWTTADGDTERLAMAGVGIAAELSVEPTLGRTDHAFSSTVDRFAEIELAAGRLFENMVVIGLPGRDSAEPAAARPRLFGGFAFQEGFVPDNTWAIFKPAHFVLPHYQFVVAGDQRFLTINGFASPDDDLDGVIEGLRAALLARLDELASWKPAAAAAAPTAERLRLRYPMSRETWNDMVVTATERIAGDALDKVVLSRACEVVGEKPFDPIDIVEYLSDAYSDCYRFAFEPLPHTTFVGATPELLIQKSGRQLRTTALAGSAARGIDKAADRQLEQGLLESAKDRREHAFVASTVCARLSTISPNVAAPAEPGVMKLRNIQHLATPITAELVRAGDASVVSLARLLHPTPAMGGSPTSAALRFLEEYEPVPRGWYAAPFGWFDSDGDGAFVVAIRAAICEHDRAWLYAGAGIVSGSDPLREWQETDLKFRPMLAALGYVEAA